MLAAVIFDCDGVLFDSWRANVAYYNAIRAGAGLGPMTPAWEHRVHFLASAQVLTEMFGADPAGLAHAQRVARGIAYEPFFALMDPVPGLHDVLAALRRSYRLAMATNRGTTVHEVVRRFGLSAYLELAVGVLDVARPKPHPDMIEKCLAHLGVAPEAAVYVGDAESDRTAADAAGVHFVAVGERPWAEHQVRHLGDLPERLATLALHAPRLG